MNNDNEDKTVLHVSSPGTGKAPKARLICLDDMLDEELHGLEIELTDQDESIGRLESNSIRINYKKLSRKHAKIIYSNGIWEIEDLDSANGVFLNEERIQRALLGHGDILLIGQIPFRFELDNLQDDHQDLSESPSGYSGDAGTMYAQHVGVLQSLAVDQEASDDEPEQTSERDRDSRPVNEVNVQVKSTRTRKTRILTRAIAISLAIIVLVAGFYFYGQYSDSKSVADLIYNYNSDVADFIDEYESITVSGSLQSSEIELGELRKITARVDLALQQHPDTQELSDLRARLLFLEFERNFDHLLDSGRIYEAEQLINKNRSDLLVLSDRAANVQSNPIRFTGDLLDLAQVVVEFERFKERYPDPTNANGARPDEYTLQKMRETKDKLIEKKRTIYQLLSVVYLRFHRLLGRIEEQNVRLLNRWHEIIKREIGANS